MQVLVQTEVKRTGAGQPDVTCFRLYGHRVDPYLLSVKFHVPCTVCD